MPQASPSIAILGAGIGGLTLAVALKHRGIEAKVNERASSISEIGAGLLLSPNAVSILHALGLREELRAIALETPAWRVLDSRGNVLSELHPRTAHVPAISLRRSDLQQLLVRHLPPQSIRLGHAAAHTTGSSTRGPSVEFASGEQIASDLVVAADGIHSQTRDGFFQDVKKRPCHYVGWRAMVDFVPKGWENGVVTETWGRGMRFGLAATGSNRCYWYASANRGPDLATTSQDRKPLLLDLFKDWHQPVTEVLSATPAEQILETSIAERPLPRHWHQHGVVLLGDAAHAMTPNLGQGAAMAIEDAWELSECLAASPQMSAALNRYERRRRRRVQMVQWVSRFVGLAIQMESPFLCDVRDKFVASIPAAVTNASVKWIFTPRVRA